MFLAMGRENVEFGGFHDANKCAQKFKKSLFSFQDVEIRDSFFDSILYCLSVKLSENSSKRKH